MLSSLPVSGSPVFTGGISVPTSTDRNLRDVANKAGCRAFARPGRYPQQSLIYLHQRPILSYPCPACVVTTLLQPYQLDASETLWLLHSSAVNRKSVNTSGSSHVSQSHLYRNVLRRTHTGLAEGCSQQFVRSPPSTGSTCGAKARTEVSDRCNGPGHCSTSLNRHYATLTPGAACSADRLKQIKDLRLEALHRRLNNHRMIRMMSWIMTPARISRRLGEGQGLRLCGPLPAVAAVCNSIVMECGAAGGVAQKERQTHMHDDEVETSAETEGDARRDAGGEMRRDAQGCSSNAQGCSRMLKDALTCSHTFSHSLRTLQRSG